MPRIFDDAQLHDQPDAKTRRKLQDQRRNERVKKTLDKRR